MSALPQLEKSMNTVISMHDWRRMFAFGCGVWLRRLVAAFGCGVWLRRLVAAFGCGVSLVIH